MAFGLRTCLAEENRMQLLVRLRRLFRRDSGQDLIEYVVLTGLLALATVAALNSVRTQVGAVLQAIVARL